MVTSPTASGENLIGPSHFLSSSIWVELVGKKGKRRRPGDFIQLPLLLYRSRREHHSNLHQ